MSQCIAIIVQNKAFINGHARMKILRHFTLLYYLSDMTFIHIHQAAIFRRYMPHDKGK